MIRRSRTALVLVSVLMLGLAACGSSKKATPSGNAGNRPSTTATLQIV